MEKFREIEVNLQNKINEMLGIDILFDDYVKERNEYDKELFNSLINNNAKLSNKIDKAIEHIEESLYILKGDGDIPIATSNVRNRYIKPLLKILKGEENESTQD